MAQNIYVIDNESELKDILSKMFKGDKDFKFKKVDTKNVDEALKNIPSLFIINEDTIDVNILEICKKIRSNEDNSITPIIVISSNKEKEHRIEILKECVEHYIKVPIDKSIYILYLKT